MSEKYKNRSGTSKKRSGGKRKVQNSVCGYMMSHSQHGMQMGKGGENNMENSELSEITYDLIKDLKSTLKSIDRKTRKKGADPPSGDFLLGLSRCLNSYINLLKQYQLLSEKPKKNYYDSLMEELKKNE